MNNKKDIDFRIKETKAKGIMQKTITLKSLLIYLFFIFVSLILIIYSVFRQEINALKLEQERSNLIKRIQKLESKNEELSTNMDNIKVENESLTKELSHYRLMIDSLKKHITIVRKNNVEKYDSDMYEISSHFIASGWMGDGEYGTKNIDFNEAYVREPHSVPTCIRVKYTFGQQRWAGVYWQNKPDNWGDEPGYNFSKKGFTKITFWAKGEIGKEVLEFRSGGIHNNNKNFSDSYNVTTGRIHLTSEWKKYEIDLRRVDLTSVIGGFCWVASSDYNNQDSIIFYIDDIYFE